MQPIELSVVLTGEAGQMLEIINKLKPSQLGEARLEVYSKVPRSIRLERLWINPIRESTATRSREDVSRLAFSGRIDRETAEELYRLIGVLERLNR